MALAVLPAVYSSGTVEKDLREFFFAERKRKNLTQQEVADRGGASQGEISKIERDEPYQPGIGTFIRAVRGLGMPLSEFFARFERRPIASVMADASAAAEPSVHRTDLRDSKPPPISEDDTRGFLRIVQQALRGSVVDDALKLDGIKKPVRQKRTRSKKPITVKKPAVK